VLSMAIQIKRLDGRRLILSQDGDDLVLPTQPEALCRHKSLRSQNRHRETLQVGLTQARPSHYRELLDFSWPAVRSDGPGLIQPAGPVHDRWVYRTPIPK